MMTFEHLQTVAKRHDMTIWAHTLEDESTAPISVYQVMHTARGETTRYASTGPSFSLRDAAAVLVEAMAAGDM